MNARQQPPFPGHGSPRPVPPRAESSRGWKKIAGWIGAGILASILLLQVGVVTLLHNARFHDYLLRTAQEKASAALGSDVQIRNFTLHWSGMSFGIDAYGLVVYGSPPYAAPPLMEADRLHLGITVVSLLRRSWYVNDLRVEHPVWRIFVDRSGRTNLPRAKQQEAGAPPASSKVFELGVRHLLLERGEIYCNNRESELSADLRDFLLQAEFEPLAKRYTGALSYRDGHLRMKDANPAGHSLDAHFTATPDEFRLESANMTSGNSRLSATGGLRDYTMPHVHFTYQASIDSGEVRRILKNASLPTGVIHSSGVVDYVSRSDRPMLATVRASGDLQSVGLIVSDLNARVELRDVGAHYSVADGDVTVSGIHAEALGGSLSGLFTVRDLAGTTRSHLSASARGLSTADLQAVLQGTMIPPAQQQIALHGRANATADAVWGKTIQDGTVRADATVQAHAQTAQGSNAMPVRGELHAQYDGRSGQISIENSFLRTPNSSVMLDGTVSKQAALNIHAESQDLHELETMAAVFRPAGSEPMGVYGRGNVTARVTGAMQNPQVTGQLTAENLRWKGSSWKLLRTNIAAGPSEVRLENGELEAATGGRITFQLFTALQRWSLTQSSPFQITIHASKMNAADLLAAAGSTLPASGTLSADIVASGTQLSPKGQGTINLSSGRVQGETVRSANVQFEGTGKQIHANLKVDMPAGTTNGNVVYEPATGLYTAELHAPGLKLQQLETVKAQNLELQGILELNASGRGTTRDPQMQAVIAIAELHIRDQIVRSLKLQTNVANHVANFSLDSDVLNTHAGGHGTIELQGEYLADASFDTQVIPIAPLVAIYLPSQAGNLNGQTEVHGTLRGPLKDRKRVEAHLSIPRLSLNYKNTIQLAAQGPIRADYSDGVLKMQRSVIRGTGTEMTLEATVPMERTAPMSILMRGVVDLRLAQLVNNDITSGGELRFDIDSTGQRTDPNVQGQIRIVNASFAASGAPVGLRDGNGVLTLTRDRLNVTQFQGSVGGGNVTASGGVVYQPQLQFDLAMAAQGVRLLYDQSVRTTLNSNLALSGTYENALLSGQLGVDQVSFTSDFDVSDLMEQFSGDVLPPPGQGFGQNLRLDIAVQTPGGLNLTSRTLSLAEPVVLGRLNLNGGDLIFSGNRYQLQGGTIDFSNRSRTEPVVDMSMSTTISRYDIQMHFWGPVEHLHTNYASDPSLPPSDIINLIAFGKTSEADAANPTPPGTLGAQSLLAAQASSQITNRVEKLAGISQLSIDPVLGSSQQSPGARIAVQQRITSKIFVTFASDVTSTQREAIKLEYQANRKTSLDAIRDQNGGFSFETTFRKEW